MFLRALFRFKNFPEAFIYKHSKKVPYIFKLFLIPSTNAHKFLLQ